MPTSKATNGDWGLSPVTKVAATMDENAKTDPTDRSIPPVKMTRVIPIARIPLIDVCRRMLLIFSGVRKYLLRKVSATHSRRKAIMIPYCVSHASRDFADTVSFEAVLAVGSFDCIIKRGSGSVKGYYRISEGEYTDLESALLT